MTSLRWRLLLQSIVAIVMIVATNSVVARLGRTTAAHRLLHELEQPVRIDGIAIGNSLIEAGFDPDVFNRASSPSGNFVNAGLGATYPVEHLLLLRHELAQHPETRTVIYGFFDLQLTNRPTGGWEDLTGNRALSYYVEPYFAADLYAPRSPWFAWRMNLVGHVPLLVERLAVWAKVERLRRSLAAVGMPAVEHNRFGRAADFNALESSTPAQFAALCRQTVEQRLPLTPAIDEMLRELAARQPATRVVLVLMPISPSHREHFYALPEWSAYIDYLGLLLQDRHCELLLASDWIEGQQSFIDNVHLNADGAAAFSRRLATTLISGRSISSAR